MDAIILSKEQFTKIENSLDELNKKIEENQKAPKEVFLDNQEFIQLMNISKRTAQTWRDQGRISFSQIGSKIYYLKTDIEQLLDKNSRKACGNNKRNF